MAVRRLRRAALALLAITVIALPPAAGAARTHGTVITIDRAHHAIRLVVHSQARTYSYRGVLPRSLRVGTVVSFDRVGTTAIHLRVAGHATSVHVRGTVVSTPKGERIRVADGGTLRIGDQSTGAVTVTLDGFPPNATVNVTVSISPADEINIQIQLVRPSGGCDQAATCPLTLEGHVTGIDPTTDTFTVDTGDGSQPYTLTATTSMLVTIAVGDGVTVKAHRNNDGSLTADAIRVHKQTTGGGSRDVYGTIQQISDSFFVIATPMDGQQAAMVQISATAAQLIGLNVGDIVHAVVHRHGETWVADSIVVVTPPSPPPPSSGDLVGTVIHVGQDSLGLMVPEHGPFSIRATSAQLAGVQSFDRLNVMVHTDNQHLVADSITELSTTLNIHDAVIAALTDTTITIGYADANLTLSVSPTLRAGLTIGEHVHVTAHHNPPEAWITDALQPASSPPPPPPPTGDLTGYVIHVADGSFGLMVPPHSTYSISATTAQLAGVQSFDRVEVLVHTDNGHMVADSITELPTTLNVGTTVISALTDTTMTITYANASLTLSITAGQRAGLTVGEHVHVSAHHTPPDGWIVDAVSPAI